MQNNEITNPDTLPENQTPGADAPALPIVYVDPSQFKLDPVEASEIELAFIPQLEKMKELETEYLAILDESPDDPEVGKKADTLRKKYVKVRTETDKIHTKQKAYYLAGGRFCDAWEKTQETVSKLKEEKLASITNHAKIEAEKQRVELEKDRIELLRPVLELPSYAHLQLGTMATDVFYAYLKTTTDAHAERVSKEQKEKEEREAEAEKTDRYNKRAASIAALTHVWNPQTPDYIQLTKETTPEEWLVIRDRVVAHRDAWIAADNKRKEDAAKLQKENDELRAQINNPAPAQTAPSEWKQTVHAAHQTHGGPLAGTPAPQPVAASTLAAAVSAATAGATIPPPDASVGAGELSDAQKLTSFVDRFEIPERLHNYRSTAAMNAHAEIVAKFAGFKTWADGLAKKV